ncbi:MAG: hypothetical protein ACKOBN_07540 [Flavobacteriales bacterium]
MKQLLAIVIVCIHFLSANAQDLAQLEHEAAVILNQIRSSKDDLATDAAHLSFKKAMNNLVKSKGFFDYEFKELKIANLFSADQTVRLITWNIEYSDLSYSYGGFILRREEGREKVLIQELNDQLDPYSTKPEGVIDAKAWYGAIYFKIIDFSFQGKTCYLLFGYDAGTTMSNYKILDVLSFSGQTARFGAAVFKDPKQTKKRVVLEYSNMATLSLEFEPKRNRIVFDHLSAESPALEGVASYYFPDMSYDAYIYDADREIWIFEQDVVATNPADVGEKYFYSLNRKTGAVEKSKMNKDWINPSDPANRANGQHQAALPAQSTEEFPEIPLKERRKWFKRNRNYNPESY